jgi:hypothetical protein
MVDVQEGIAALRDHNISATYVNFIPMGVYATRQMINMMGGEQTSGCRLQRGLLGASGLFLLLACYRGLAKA